MSQRTTDQYRAFSMIELLIVVAILGITASVILVDSSASRTVQYLDAAGREVEAVIRGAQNAALSGAQVGATDKPCGFQIDWSGSSYTVTYRYKDSAGNCNQSSTLSSHALSNGVAFNNTGSFEFTLPFGTVSVNQTIILTKLEVFQVVCVYTSGRIMTASGSSCP